MDRDLQTLKKHIKGVPNPDWHRPFEVEKRVEVDGATAFLCRFTEGLPASYPGGPVFDRFGAVVFKAFPTGAAVEAWPILTYPDGPSEDVTDEGLERRARGEMERYRCPGCGENVKFVVRQRQVGPEVIEVVYVCPQCGHREIDVVD